MGELTLFLGLQVKQKEDRIFISQDKYVTEILKKFGFTDVKTARTPMETQKPDIMLDIMFVVCAYARFQVNPESSHFHVVKRIFRYLKGQPKLGIWYPKDSPFDLVAYTNSDYAGASLDRKSTTGGCQFLEYRLISWQCKKQTVVTNSTTEAEYIAASNCCGQVLWIQNQLLDYGYNFMQTKIHIDNEITICIVKNPVFHSKTKHIEIRHHFIRDSYEKKLIQMIKIHTNKNIIDLLTKAFDDIVKAKTVNGEVQLQALVDKKKVIITESTIRRDLQLEDAEGTDCLPNATIFEQLALIGYEKLSQKLTFYKAFFSPKWKFLIHTILQCLSAKTTIWNEFSSIMAFAIICLATNQKFNFSKYIFDNMVKNVDSMVKFWMYPRFVQVFVNKQVGNMSHHKRIYVTPVILRRYLGTWRGKGKRKQKSRKSMKKNTEVPQPSGSTDNVLDENVPTTSNDPLLSGEDRLKLTELMDLCTNLQKNVLDLEKANTAQDSEIASLKKKVKKLERRNKSRTSGLKRLRKVGLARRVESFDEASLGDQEDASKQGRRIADIDDDAEVTLIDETTGRNDDNLMFDTGVLDEQEVEVEKTLIEIKAAKPKVRGVMIQEPSEFTTTTKPAASKPSHDKGKAKMIESEKPLKKKDQIMYDQEVALNLQAQLQAELEEEEERLTR
ncbi:hypothetical protein Tco_1082429 [Tanacetum coccineum]|uniref:Uncharacterized protein n=1 Tax=Tanacetum coccineum TaxID=301880 RepID=A0ABQ5I1M4_9ASTR